MIFRPATKDEVCLAETALDRAFEAHVKLPSEDYETSLRYALVVTEDRQRLPMTRLAKTGPEGILSWTVSCDEAKYALKDALPFVSKLPRRSTKRPETLEDERYALAVELLRHCGDYLNVRCAFASYHSSRADCRIDDTGTRLKFRPNPQSERYDTCSQLLAFGDDDSPSTEIQQWFCGMKKPPPLLIDIIERTSRDADQVRVSFDSALAAKLGGHVAQPHSVLPAAWEHPNWGTGTELRSIFHALQTIAAYHLLAVIGAARLHELPQVGGMSALLELQREDLIARVVSVAGVSAPTVRKVVDSLVYGRGVKSPDPALQPLIAIGEDSVVTSPMLVLTSNMPRNFLTLLARLDPPAFNAASSVFEREMTERVSSVLAGKSWPFRPGYQPKWLQSTAGEIDLLVADPASRNLLVVELRWMLPAGDAREVIARNDDLPRKGQQATRKTAAVEARLIEVLSDLGVTSGARGWRVTPLVVTSGFVGPAGGVLSVPEEAWLTGARQSRTVAEFLRTLHLDNWLPRAGRDFERQPREFSAGGRSLEWIGIRPTRRGMTRAMARFHPEQFAAAMADSAS